jgi:hypothetical protein
VDINTLSPGGVAQANLEFARESMILRGVSRYNIKSYEILDMREAVLGKTNAGKGQNHRSQNGWFHSSLLD